MNLGYALTELDKENDQIVMSFDAPGGTQQRAFDVVILALPFTCLRNVKGLDRLRLSPEKLKCIRELGMGQNAKIMVGTKSQVWRSPRPQSDLPVLSNGSICSDLAFQDIWETSRAQPSEAGILTDFLGGKAGQTDAKSALDAFRASLAKMSPKMAESLDPTAVTSMFWSRYPYTLGSYAAAKVGQYTTMLDEAGRPALDGRLQFAGEHTSGANFFGYMNGGVVSGNRAAEALAKLMAAS
jgi:monoamine oxidase